MTNATIKKRPTIKEIGQEANVSAAAVYAVLNAKTNTTIRVAEATRKHILDTAKKMGYIPNDIARSMVTGKTNTIGVLVYSLKQGFFSDFFVSFDNVCYSKGYSVLIASSEFDRERELRNLNTFLAKRVDAVIVAMDYPNENEKMLRKMTLHGIPVIHLGGVEEPRPPYPSVGFAEESVSKKTAEHLYELGHRRVIHLNAYPNAVMHQLREQMFIKAWQNLPDVDPVIPHHVDNVVHGGAELAKKISQMDPDHRPTAVVCSTDSLAVNLVTSLWSHDVNVPNDISVIGCDDISLASECVSPLTTLRLPTDELARQSWGLLEKLMESPESMTGDACPHLAIEPELIIRRSTGRCLKS